VAAGGYHGGLNIEHRPLNAEHRREEKRKTVMAGKRTYALGRLKAGAMNQTEARYGALLKLRLMAGEVAWYRFEGIKLRLADSTFYTPDFAVMLADGTMELHEVKGFWEDDARVKIKVAAEMYPFRFVAVKSQRGSFQVEEF
jgi:hypothetical protein